MHDTAEVAQAQSSAGGSGWSTLLMSIAALLISAISLYQTVLKQANLNLFIPETISYTRDSEDRFEVFIIPLTITNSGARDGVVSSLRLVGTSKQDGKKVTFKASYFAKAEYFMAQAGRSQTGVIKRPKEPYSPIPVTGYSGFGGTILFYSDTNEKNPFMKGEGEYEFELIAKTNLSENSGVMDSFFRTKIKPIRFTASSGKVANFFPGWIANGNTWRMSVKDN